MRPFLLTLLVPGRNPGSLWLWGMSLMKVQSRSDIIAFVQHPPFAKEETRPQLKLRPAAINLWSLERTKLIRLIAGYHQLLITICQTLL